MSLPLLQTKLYAPPSRAHLVPRDHLLDRLRDQAARPLTLVCAPAGFGKTTLVSAWIDQGRGGPFTAPDALGDSVNGAVIVENRQSKNKNLQFAWLSLDEDDNDPIRFFTYLIAALQT